jgi:hypothetical protein
VFLHRGGRTQHRSALESRRRSTAFSFADGDCSRLSKTAAFTSLNRSSAPPFRMMMNRFAARLIPPMMATGVARISGHGVATTRIEKRDPVATRRRCARGRASVRTGCVRGAREAPRRR